jgi:hypothetical protein
MANANGFLKILAPGMHDLLEKALDSALQNSDLTATAKPKSYRVRILLIPCLTSLSVSRILNILAKNPSYATLLTP